MRERKEHNMEQRQAVVVAVTPCLRGQETVDFVMENLLTNQGQLVVLHVLTSIPALPPLPCGDKKQTRILENTWWRTHSQEASQQVAHLLTPHRRICRDMQISVQIRIVWNKSVEKGLVEEAGAVMASKLVVGSSGRKLLSRKFSGPGPYCCQKAPHGCNVLIVSGGSILQQSLGSMNSLRSPRSVIDLAQNFISGKTSQAKFKRSLSVDCNSIPLENQHLLNSPTFLRSKKWSPDISPKEKEKAKSAASTPTSSSFTFSTSFELKEDDLDFDGSCFGNSESYDNASLLENGGHLDVNTVDRNVVSANENDVNWNSITVDWNPNSPAGFSNSSNNLKGNSISTPQESLTSPTEESENLCSPKSTDGMDGQTNEYEQHAENEKATKKLSQFRYSSHEEKESEAGKMEYKRPSDKSELTLVLPDTEGPPLWLENFLEKESAKSSKGDEKGRVETIEGLKTGIGVENSDLALLEKLGSERESSSWTSSSLSKFVWDDNVAGVKPLVRQGSWLAMAGLGGLIRQRSGIPSSIMSGQSSPYFTQYSYSGETGYSLSSSILSASDLLANSLTLDENHKEDNSSFGGNFEEKEKNCFVSPIRMPSLLASLSFSDLKDIKDLKNEVCLETKGGEGKEDTVASMRKLSSTTVPWKAPSPEFAGGLKFFQYSEIEYATNGFSKENLVGKGGFAEVFKGVLPSGFPIAVKRLSQKTKAEVDFLSEVGIVSHVHHPNALSLLGCSIGEKSHLLIYELLPRGSLERNLHSRKRPPMDWNKRLKVAIGAAKGLAHLHNGNQRRIIHRDVKTANILLTMDWEAQIADFGLAKWVPQTGNFLSTGAVEGTLGYMAPELFMHGEVTEMTDTYAFGLVLLELMTGKRPIFVESPHKQQNLITWAKPHLESGRLLNLVDPRLSDVHLPSFRRMAAAALLCLRSSPGNRPSMGEVVELLSNNMLSNQRLEKQWPRLVENTKGSLFSEMLRFDSVGKDYTDAMYRLDMQHHLALAWSDDTIRSK